VTRLTFIDLISCVGLAFKEEKPQISARAVTAKAKWRMAKILLDSSSSLK
jgi:hypothetical protein